MKYLFKKEAKILQKRLLERGYTKSCLKKTYKRAIESNRNYLLYGTKKDKNTDNNTRIIIKYSSQHSKIWNVIQKYWHLLSMDPNIDRFIFKMPSITFRPATSIKDHIIHSEYKGDVTPVGSKEHTRVEVIVADTYVWVPHSAQWSNL